MVRVLDIDCNNSFIDLAPEVVAAPSAEDIRVKDPEHFMQRLKEITSPTETLKQYVISVFNPYTQNETHEGKWTRAATFSALAFGWFFGGIINTRDYHEEYLRNHNASVFDSKYRAKRHHFDTFFFKLANKGAVFGIRTSLLVLGASMISFGTISVRNKLYYPDWAIGFAALGAISRSWLGTRGLLAGGGFGLLAGTFGYGIVRACELANGTSVTEFRYYEEMEYARRRKETRDRLQRQRQTWVNEKI